jgi:hypothetical protein
MDACLRACLPSLLKPFVPATALAAGIIVTRLLSLMLRSAAS